MGLTRPWELLVITSCCKLDRITASAFNEAAKLTLRTYTKCFTIIALKGALHSSYYFLYISIFSQGHYQRNSRALYVRFFCL